MFARFEELELENLQLTEVFLSAEEMATEPLTLGRHTKDFANS